MKGTIFLLTVLFFDSQITSANILKYVKSSDCDSTIKKSDKEVKKNTYEFKAAYTCRVPGTKENIEKFAIEYKQEIQDTAEKVHAQGEDDNGSYLETTHKVETKHGTMKVRFLHRFQLTEDKSFSYSATSKEIKGTGDTKNTQFIEDRIDLSENANEQIQINTKNLVQIKKPSLAPTSYFKKKVWEDLEEQVHIFMDSIKNKLKNQKS